MSPPARLRRRQSTVITTQPPRAQARSSIGCGSHSNPQFQLILFMQKSLRTLFVFAGLALALEARAQWATQTIQLHGGWNAVFVEVQPEPSDCDAAFTGLPVESAWAFNRRLAPVQFIQD